MRVAYSMGSNGREFTENLCFSRLSITCKIFYCVLWKSCAFVSMLYRCVHPIKLTYKHFVINYAYVICMPILFRIGWMASQALRNLRKNARLTQPSHTYFWLNVLNVCFLWGSGKSFFSFLLVKRIFERFFCFSFVSKCYVLRSKSIKSFYTNWGR